MTQPKYIDHIRIITVSGRIASGTTTLAQKLSKYLNRPLFEGGALFERIHKKLHVPEYESHLRPDKFDLDFEEEVKNIAKTEKNIIIQSHLAGFDAQGIEGVYKILTLCMDKKGNDKTDIGLR